MPGSYQNPITILEAINAIDDGFYLLPALQRKFEWSSQQICTLFDSILRGYPINAFMLWEINEGEIKNNYKFYQVLKSYCKRFNEENPHVPTNAQYKNFKAIIDGQQRLTSLYIGLKGTYAYKQPRVWWPETQDDSILPPRKLYLDLLSGGSGGDRESLMRYDFRFLTEQQYQDVKLDQESHWYCLHKVMEQEHVGDGTAIQYDIVKPYLEKEGIDNVDAERTLVRLYEAIHKNNTIHYFNETSQEIDYVLDVFIRTNSGGTKLSFSDLLMSIVVSHWDGDFRNDVDSLISTIHQSGNEMGFYMERDWILKTCLVLIDADVKFQVKNFGPEQVSRIQKEWDGIKECIKSTLKLIRGRFGINPQSLTSKNAVIPICYYLYRQKQDEISLYKSINNLSRHSEERQRISQWFYMVLLKGIFGGQADTILASMREVLKQNLSELAFPLEQVINRYKGTNKDLRFDEEYIDSLLDIQHGEGRCRALLHLLFPEMNPTEIFHIDHLHPKSKFKAGKLDQYEFLKDDDDLRAFYSERKNWNAIPNLHLLNESQNMSKQDSELKDWLAESSVHLTEKDLLVEGVNLGFDDFKNFYGQRRAALKTRLMRRVYMSATLQAEQLVEAADEEVVAEG